MKVNRLFLKLNEKEVMEEDIDFSSGFSDPNHVKKINSCHVKLELVEYGDVLECDMYLNADVIASCAYTLDDVPYKVKVHEKMYFSSEEDDKDSDTIYYEPENEINFDDYALSYIIANVPHHLHKPGAKLPAGGNGYRVLTEDDLAKERSEGKKSSPFDCLDDLDL